jgi:hypothetical protein
MKKTLIIALFLSCLSCSPYVRIFLSQESRSTFLEDSCDVHMIRQLHQVLDSTDIWTLQNPTMLLSNMVMDATCDYYTKKIYEPQENDSAIWLFTIKPFLTGKEQIILGNLYTLYPAQDSVIVLERRVKEYSQTEDFERGKYIILTYYIENDTTIRKHLGKKKL